MKECPILFSAPMMRAILEGRKAQTRRAIKPVGSDDSFVLLDYGNGWWPYRSDDGESVILRDGNEVPHSCPYGQPESLLWVRETFFAYGRWEHFSTMKERDEWHFVDMTLKCDRAYQYAADNQEVPLARGRSSLPGWYRRPSIHMPRWASRILLEVTGIRVERLQDISEADARAEGCEVPAIIYPDEPRSSYSYVEQYRLLWESINGPGSWDANPWVWVVEFKREAA